MFKIKFPLLLLLLTIFSKALYSQSFKINDRTKIYTSKVNENILHLKVDNNLSIPISVRVGLVLENLKSDQSGVVLAVVPPKVSGKIIAVMQRQELGQPYKCTFTWRTALGDTTKTPDMDYSYGYPFEKTERYKVSQGPYGNFSHSKMFAYDFSTPVGTPICAARDGIIALVKDDSSTGGPDKKYVDDANFISIYHQDGTLAYYYHLEKGGVAVKEGQFVKQGQIIGYSGNTGFSNGPHLHFEITQSNISSDTKKWIDFKWELEGENALTLNSSPAK